MSGGGRRAGEVMARKPTPAEEQSKLQSEAWVKASELVGYTFMMASRDILRYLFGIGGEVPAPKDPLAYLELLQSGYVVVRDRAGLLEEGYRVEALDEVLASWRERPPAFPAVLDLTSLGWDDRVIIEQASRVSYHVKRAGVQLLQELLLDE